MIYKNALITTKDRQFFGWIEIENGILKGVNEGKTNLEGFDCNNNILMPGFIDSHTHGGFGFSFNDDLKDLKKYENYVSNLKKEGLVAFVGSCVTATLDKLRSDFIDINNLIFKSNNKKLPKLVGWYYEGPFISKAKKGAHEENLIIPLDEKFLNDVKHNFKNFPIIFTVDASKEQNQKLIKKYQNDFIFALGHSDANYEQAKLVLTNGIKRITHLYNAMSGFSHSNKLGIVNAMFNKEFNSDLNIELIADGVHVANEVIKYTYKNFNIDNLSVITDSLSPKGLENGEYKLGNLDIEKKDHWFYLKGTTTLSGSALPYNEVLKNFKNITNCSWEELVKVSSYNSARNLNLPNYYGDFIINEKVNFVLINKDLEIIKIFID